MGINNLIGRFWTRFHELLMDIESEGFTVEYATEEYIEISVDDDSYIVHLGGTGNTMWINGIEAE